MREREREIGGTEKERKRQENQKVEVDV